MRTGRGPKGCVSSRTRTRERSLAGCAFARRSGPARKEREKNLLTDWRTDRRRRAAWWPRCAARRWRAVDRGADSAAAPSHAAGRVASSAPRQTRDRGAAAAAKNINVNFPFSSRLVSSCRGRARARRAPVSPRSLREGRFEPGASRRSGGTRRQNARRSPHGDAAALAPPDIMLISC